MTKILVVDDAEADRYAAGRLLDTGDSILIDYAEDGNLALEQLRRMTPDLVLTDLVMPGVNGLDLLKEIRSLHPLVPVVLMTAYGSEDVVLAALEAGAAGYVSKDRFAQDLVDTVQRVLAASREEHMHAHLMKSLDEWTESFVLRNDVNLVPPLLSHLRHELTTMDCCNESDRVRIIVALHEALLNAYYHGNLELNLDQRNKSDNYAEVAEQRCRQLPYRDRQIYVRSNLLRDEAEFVIRDEGPGFDPAQYRDPMRPENISQPTGRGVVLMRTFFDEVNYNEQGNEVTLIHRRRPAPTD